MKKREHTAIMVQEICDSMPSDTQWIFDGTLGHAGHSIAMLKTCEKAKLLGCDRDEQMLARAKNLLSDSQERVIVEHGTYDMIDKLAQKHDIDGFDFILLDIGINREHIADPDRGFSIKQEGPLDMRFDQTVGETAKELLDKIGGQELAEAMEKYGDFREKRAEEIAHHILREHKHTRLETTLDLKQSLRGVGIGERKCAVVFQVIRILVNHELDHLENFLAKYYNYLNTGGRCAIITFHSIEDRIVKQAFKSQEENGLIQRVNKKVIIASRKEQQKNKASKSAKLRIVERC